MSFLPYSSLSCLFTLKVARLPSLVTPIMPSRPLLDTWHRIIDYLLAQRRSLFELVYQYPRVLGHTPKSDRDVDHNAGSSSSHPHHAGKRKALLVGISYESREDEVFRQLDGPHTDIEMMRAYLKGMYMSPSDVFLLSLTLHMQNMISTL